MTYAKKPRPERPVHPVVVQLIQARHYRDWSRLMLARRTGVSAGTIGQMESGLKVPLLTTVADVAQALDLQICAVPVGAVSDDALRRSYRAGFDAGVAHCRGEGRRPAHAPINRERAIVLGEA